jgi:RNA polymerase sigma-70 factor (ECF subfamily)
MARSVDELSRAGHAAWPDVRLEPAALAAYLDGRAWELSSDERAADLFLACACALDTPGALDAFDRAFMSQVGLFLSHMRVSPAFVDDVKQLVRERLFVGPSPKIAEYTGAGELRSWLRVIAVRTALNLKRKRTESLADRDASSDDRRPPSGNDPELDFIKERYRAEFKAALEQSLATLSSERRNLLRLHFVEGLTLDEMSNLFNVHRATVARHIAQAREAIVDEARRLLSDRLRVDSDEFDSMMGLLRSRLELSLPALFRAP